jgi:hypothetical protein
MDFSGIGMTIVSCIFMILIPPIVAGILFVPVFIIQKFVIKTTQVNGYPSKVLFLILYILSFIGSCFYIYFFYLQYMYVM